MRTNIMLEEALDMLLNHCNVLEMEQVPLCDAFDKVIAEDIVASENIPPFARSVYDGYAFRSEDTRTASKDQPVLLEIMEEIPAGYASQNKVAAGQAVKILTGAPVPDGADAVINFEATSYDDKTVKLYDFVPPGANVAPVGEDVAMGRVIAGRGIKVTAPLIGLMAALGITAVNVYRRPKIGIISTGDELVDIAENLSPGKIRNSNSYTLFGYIKSLGAEPYIVGSAKDKAADVADLMRAGLTQTDMIITTGGVSVGDYDVVKEAIKIINAEALYWKLDIKPGSANLGAMKDGKLIIGLSGNPAAAMVAFQLLAMPCIRKISGLASYLNQKIEVCLLQDFSKKSPTRRFLRGRLAYQNGKTYIDLIGEQGNGILSSMLGTDILAEIPEGSGPAKSEDKLQAFLVQP